MTLDQLHAVWLEAKDQPAISGIFMSLPVCYWPVVEKLWKVAFVEGQQHALQEMREQLFGEQA